MRRSGFKGLVAAGLVATGIAASTTVVDASDMFLKLKGVPGDSTDKVHKGETEVLAWSWGTSTGDALTKKGNAPIACIQDLELRKLIDSGTPSLIVMAVNQALSAEGILTVRTSGEFQTDILTLTLTNVSVKSYQISAESGDNLLAESVVLHFESLQGVYTQMIGGKLTGNEVPFSVSGACP